MRAAILSLHSHADRSFLDDQLLALVSGDLRRRGVENDLIVAVLDVQGGGDPTRLPAMSRLIETLKAYDPIVYERVWDRAIVEHLRASLPGRTFVHCVGEHALGEPVADYLCGGDLRRSLPALLDHLRSPGGFLPPETIDLRLPGPRSPAVLGPGSLDREALRARLPYEPNLRPIVVHEGPLPVLRTHPITASAGCPYQADARDNPIYAGIAMPERVGRGCAFCTIGNHYEGLAADEAVSCAMEQIRYVRAHAPERDSLRLKDQNPFGYLTRLVQACATESLGEFTLLLETRTDWMLKNRIRFEQAIEAARLGGIRLAPYLVGIENFSQPELDRFNKGATAAGNVEFVEQVWRWAEIARETFDLGHASFGFILFTPWTTIDDLRLNLAAVERTRFDRLRGSLLLSRVRLYPDGALYYLAQRDGLLADSFADVEADSSRRYGYYPARPWRFLHPEVAHFAALAAVLSRRTGGRDELSLWRCLIDAFEAAARIEDVTVDKVAERLGRGRPAVAAHPPPR